MELKLTENDICEFGQNHNMTVEQPVDTSINLPDYCEDAQSILCCKLTPYINSNNVNGQSVIIDGTVDINVIYLTEDNKIRSISNAYNFSKTVDAGSDISDCRCTVTAKPEYTNCRTVNTRKIDVHGSISLRLNIMCNKTVKVIGNVENGDIEQKVKNIITTCDCGYLTKNMIIDEEILLPSGRKPVVGILQKNLSVCFNDCKIIGNKAVVKGEADFEVLYYDEDGKICKFNETLPQSIILEAGGFSDDCACTASARVCGAEVRIINDNHNESGFYLNAKICVTVSAQKTVEIPALFDAYSTKYETNMEKSNVTCSWSTRNIFERFSCKKALDLCENTVSSILDLSCTATVFETSADDEKINISGMVNINLLYVTHDNCVKCIENPVEFNYSLEKEDKLENIAANPYVQTSSLNYVITSDNTVEVKIELCITASVMATAVYNVVTSISVDEEKTKEFAPKGNLVVYYASAEESVWEIARKYNTSPERVMMLNSLEDDVLQTEKTLLIPCK